MEEVLIQCCNNSALVPMNNRKPPKKLRIRSHKVLPRPELLSLPVPSLSKPEKTSPPIFKQIPKPRTVHFDVNSSVNLENLSSEALKEMMTKLIQQEISILKTLVSRCSILDKLIKNTENISSFTDKETSDFIGLIEEMTKTLIKTSEMEVELGLKNRLFEKKNLENSSLKNSHGVLLKRSQQSEYELKELREKIKNLTEENIKLQKNNENERHRFAEVNNKIQTLEETLWVVTNSANFSTQDSVTKLKSAITALLKDAHFYKKEIQALRLNRDELELKIQMLTRKVKTLKNRGHEEDPLDAETIMRSSSKHLSFIPNKSLNLTSY